MAIFDGKDQYEKTKEHYRKKHESETEVDVYDKRGRKIGKKGGKKKSGFEGLHELVSLPGITVSPRAQKMFAKINMQRAREKQLKKE